MENNFVEIYKGVKITKDGDYGYEAYKGMFGVGRKTVQEVKDAIDQGFLD
jgi:hypothetical protein